MNNKEDNKFAGFKIGYKYEVGTPEYVKLVYEQYGLLPFEFMKPEKITDFQNPVIVKAWQQYNRIKSGDFMYEKNYTYQQNYVEMLRYMGIEEKLIKIVEDMELKKFIGSSDLMPYMRNYYDYLKGKKRAKDMFDSPSEAIQDFRENLIASLRDMGYDVK